MISLTPLITRTLACLPSLSCVSLLIISFCCQFLSQFMCITFPIVHCVFVRPFFFFHQIFKWNVHYIFLIFLLWFQLFMFWEYCFVYFCLFMSCKTENQSSETSFSSTENKLQNSLKIPCKMKRVGVFPALFHQPSTKVAIFYIKIQEIKRKKSKQYMHTNCYVPKCLKNEKVFIFWTSVHTTHTIRITFRCALQ